MDSDKIRICPKCGKEYKESPALSRDDNKTKICSNCGIREALEAWEESIRRKEPNT